MFNKTNTECNYFSIYYLSLYTCIHINTHLDSDMFEYVLI